MNKFPIELLWAIVSAIGGISKHLYDYLNGEEFSWSRLCARFIVHGFSGTILAIYVAQYQPELAMAIAGLGGFFGAEGLSKLKDRLLPSKK